MELLKLQQFRGYIPEGLNVNNPGWSEAEPGVSECKKPTVRVQISNKNDISGSDGRGKMRRQNAQMKPGNGDRKQEGGTGRGGEWNSRLMFHLQNRRAEGEDIMSGRMRIPCFIP